MRQLNDILNLLLESKNRVIELYNAITADVLSNPELNGLDSTSKASIWRLWAFITAVSIWVHEHLWQIFRQEVDVIVENAIPNTANWLRSQLYLFQYNHNLLFDNYSPYYEIVDLPARIVSQAAVVETTYGLVLIKVAKNDGAGGLLPLTSLEVDGVETYVDNIKPAGTITQVVSLNPDKLKIMAEIYYNPLFNLNVLRLNVEAAITNYIRNLTFNGKLYLTKLVDVIQNTDGVVDVQLNYVGAQVGVNP